MRKVLAPMRLVAALPVVHVMSQAVSPSPPPAAAPAPAPTLSPAPNPNVAPTPAPTPIPAPTNLTNHYITIFVLTCKVLFTFISFFKFPTILILSICIDWYKFVIQNFGANFWCKVSVHFGHCLFHSGPFFFWYHSWI